MLVISSPGFPGFSGFFPIFPDMIQQTFFNRDDGTDARMTSGRLVYIATLSADA